MSQAPWRPEDHHIPGWTCVDTQGARRWCRLGSVAGNTHGTLPPSLLSTLSHLSARWLTGLPHSSPSSQRHFVLLSRTSALCRWLIFTSRLYFPLHSVRTTTPSFPSARTLTQFRRQSKTKASTTRHQPQMPYSLEGGDSIVAASPSRRSLAHEVKKSGFKLPNEVLTEICRQLRPDLPSGDPSPVAALASLCRACRRLNEIRTHLL